MTVIIAVSNNGGIVMNRIKIVGLFSALEALYESKQYDKMGKSHRLNPQEPLKGDKSK
jgi:hypothetical protein